MLGWAGKNLDGISWEMCAPKKTSWGSKEKVPRCVLCAFSSSAHLASPCSGDQGAALFVVALWGSCEYTSDSSLLTDLIVLVLPVWWVVAIPRAFSHQSLFKWEKNRAVEPIALMIDSIILNSN